MKTHAQLPVKDDGEYEFGEVILKLYLADY